MKLVVELKGLNTVLGMLDGHARQVPYATRQALYATASTVRDETYQEMRSAFDRPTPMTMKSLFISKSKKEAAASATVYLKDRGMGGNYAGEVDVRSGMPEQGSMAQIIGHQWSGGARVHKRMEQAFAAHGLIKGNELLAPGPDAKLDQYGNMSRGQVQQIYTALRLHFDPYNNATQSKRSQRNAKAAGRMFWSTGMRPRFKVRRGLWGVDGRGSPRLILVVISKATYQRRIDMPAIAQRVINRDWQTNFDTALAKAIETAR